MQSTTKATFFWFLSLALCCLSANASEVRYSDFGAKGDGKTDDFAAIKKAHEHANEKGFPVRADDNANYYIGGADGTISIKTDTNFGTATFIIDDTDVENFKSFVFEVQSEHKPLKFKNVGKLSKGDTRLSEKLPGACLVNVTNDNIKRFIRRGNNQNAGGSQMDTFLVDKLGRIDSDVPLVWDFDQITRMTAYPIDKEILKIRGGRFTTIAHSKDIKNYFHRGIKITRSNVLIDGLKHLIKGEGKDGPPYRGFISISNCANVVLRDTVLSGRKYYYNIGSAGKKVAMGSYDLSISSSVNISLIRCTQANDIMDSSLWGIMSTNYCKNIVLDGCVLSRFDAHQGVANVTIRNSTMGRMGIKLTGFGAFLAENTTVKSNSFIDLRSDYGSTWKGDITIRNCRFLPQRRGNEVPIISGSNDGQHDFGYTTYLPQKVVIDKLIIEDKKPSKSYKGPVIFGNFNSRMKDKSYKAPHSQVLPKLIAHRGVKTASGKPVRVSTNSFMFKEVKLVEGK
jgi:hypothetical protein